MPDSTPVSGDGVNDLTHEDDEMANAPDGDLSNDSLELLLEQSEGASDLLMNETLANGEGAHAITRYSAARKFNQEDPIEAAATEMILQKNTA